LLEGNEHVGLLLMAECNAQRNWRSADSLVLKTIADQIVLALANAHLRRLVKDLALTEEESGLLKRASYLDVLLSEVQRACRQGAKLTVVLLGFSRPPELTREKWQAVMEAALQQIGQLICNHIRQNDIAVRYDPTTVALILPGTDEKGALFTLERLRPLLNDLRFPDGINLPVVTAGIAEAVSKGGFDPIDVVTELINRAEAALQIAVGKGGQHVLQPLSW
jgi:GGDEF domain-containing protein